MDFQSIPPVPRTDADYNKCFSAFLKAVTENNEEIINVIISKEGILQRHFSARGDTLLHIVAQRGTVATAAQMCKLELDVNSRNNFSETPLIHAITHSPDMVHLLINNGASLNEKCDQYVKPLQGSLLSGTEKTVEVIVNKIFADQRETHLPPIRVQNSEETLKALLNHTKDLLLEDVDYPLIIFFTAKIRNLELFRLASDNCKKYLDSLHDEMLVNILSWNEDIFLERTALHYAVWKQEPEVVRFLLREGADVNCKTPGNYTPLHFAAYLENEEICNILLSSGAKVSGVSPLYLVCGSYEYLNLYEDSSISCFEKSLGFVSFGSFNGSNLKSEPIFNPGIMKLLLQHRANPNFVNVDNGMTPLLGACKAGRLEPVRLLMKFGVDIRICDYKGNSALHYAARASQLEIVDLLLESGFYIDIENRVGETPLLFCLYNTKGNNVKMIEYLTDFGANINATNSEGFTPLRNASYYDCPEDVECLLESGAKFEQKFILEDYFFLLDNSRETLFAYFNLKENIFENFIGSCIPIDRFGMSDISKFCEMCQLEIKKLKCTKILENRKFSFYDFLTRDIYGTLQIIKNEKVWKVFIVEEYKDQFPCYAFLLKKRFERLEHLERTIADVVQFLSGYKKSNLPILIVDNILSFLSSSDFRNFGRALSHRKNKR